MSKTFYIHGVSGLSLSDKEIAMLESFESTSVKELENKIAMMKEVYSYETDTDFNILEYSFRKISEDDTPWSSEQIVNLQLAEKVAEAANAGRLQDAERLINFMHPRSSERKGWRYDIPDREEAIVGIAEAMYFKRMLSDNLSADFKEQPRNEAVLGLAEEQKKVVEIYNKNRYLGELSEQDVESSINRFLGGERLEAPEGKHFYHDMIPNHSRLLYELSNGNQQLYLGTVFADREVADEFARLEIGGVSATAFDNHREYGIAYTTLTPNGDTRTFSVYEHRNTDSIIINGKTNWAPAGADDRLPYSGESKNDFFAEISNEDYKQAARVLSFFIKEAQSGTLAADEELAREAPKIDWVARLKRDLPGFKTWYDKRIERE